MKRLIILLLFVIGFCYMAKASHITGGEMFYKFNGMVNGQYEYSVTLKLFMRCNSGRQFPDPTIISIFDKTNGSRVSDLSVALANSVNISLTNSDPCITNPPPVCYDVGYYYFTVLLPGSAGGYVIASQVNFRINGINNLVPGSGTIGATYTADIPGMSVIGNAPENNSADFTGSDLVIVCAGNNFSYSFAAHDGDGDKLRYSFCEAYASTNPSGNASATGLPPFPSVPYNSPGYNNSSPLGNNVHINPVTGLITGIAPPEGIYVVTVCAEEIRNGVVIATQRKDVQINVANCSIAAASLLPDYQLCGNTQTITIANQSNSPLIVTYDWEFANSSGAILFKTSTATATYTFPDTGIYSVKLAVNRGQNCSDSSKSVVKVYPGFFPDFKTTGYCNIYPTFFNDQTTSVYGTVNSWNWDFGELSGVADISVQQNPAYSYPSTGPKDVQLTVTDTKGCRDTIVKTITIINKPPISLAFNDSLICKNDNIQLQVTGNGIFSWSPAINIINANSPSPTVSPVATTTYFVNLNDNGCTNKDSVKIRVVDKVSLQAMNDTTICQGDTIQLKLISDGLQYAWSPAAQINNPSLKNPLAVTNATTNYQVKAIIGGCSVTDNIMVTTVPYPQAYAGADTTICYNSVAQLHAITNGSSWSWSPASLLNNANILNPLSFPKRTTAYIFTAFDTRGCPKAGRDTILVIVSAKMHSSAGNDTAVVIGQPLQLNASGGAYYIWSPAINLSAYDIADPIALFNEPSTGIKYKLVAFSQEGCIDSSFITIKVYKTVPSVFVPSAFTPNGDGKNDVLKPIAVGMKNIEYFNIYNRWGQLIFSTQTNGYGWDGKIGGQMQGTATFIWIVKAVEYTGVPYFQKGMVTLIR